MICVDCRKTIPGFDHHPDEMDVCDICLCKRLGIQVSTYEEASKKLDEMGDIDYELDKWVCTRITKKVD